MGASNPQDMPGQTQRVDRTAEQDQPDGECEPRPRLPAARRAAPISPVAEQRQSVPALHLHAAADDAQRGRIGDAVRRERCHCDCAEAGQ